MCAESQIYPVEINGRKASAEELAPLAFAGFAHFTAMQIRGRKAKALDLHLARLRTASLQLFGRALPDEQIRLYIRNAIAGGPDDLSLIISLYSPKGEFTVESMLAEPSVLVRGGPPSDGPQGPFDLYPVDYERPLTAVKHAGEVAKTFYLHQAKRNGFDDAVFIDRQERLSEATIWNLAFWDGETIVWPKADMLVGTMMGSVQRQLNRRGYRQRKVEVTLADLGSFCGAVVMNSWTPGIAVSSIGSNSFAESDRLVSVFHEAYKAEPTEPV